MKAKYFFGLIFFLCVSVFAQDTSQTFLSLKNTGVEEFLKTHPKYDGRGTIIFVFDTGVDMGIDGLKYTSTGDVKVIDVQDFTGESNFNFYEADVDEEDGNTIFENDDKDYKIAFKGQLPFKAVDDDYYIGLMDESFYKNVESGTPDVNGNGGMTDKFYFITFETEQSGKKYWVLYFDSNANGDLSDEKTIRTYRENYDTFQIPNQNGLPNFTFAVNIFPDKKMVTFHFDGGAHGTHVAGIAAGYQIGGNELNGVAPGAKVISCKLGSQNLAGGATTSESMKKSFLYADSLSKELKQPCIVNMSYGIGSEIEGHAVMEKFIEKLTEENPYLYICTSNGNNGPGISSTGLPAATNALFSSGAILTKEVGSDLYGATLNRDIILYFSSRGGEVMKPDVASPGACTSTVPNWDNWDRFWGTSMASPYSAGVMSLLLSASQVEYPDVKIPSQFLYKVIRESAVRMNDYTYLDQGNGYINVANAYKLLKKYIDEGDLKNYETYSITSFSPNMPGDRAPALYIRNGSYLTSNDTYNFIVNRNNFIEKDKFYRTYNLKSSADWLIPIQKNTYLRNNQNTYVSVKFDKSQMKKPGLYNGRIKAFRADKTKFPEFEMMATVVIPYEFNEENHYRMLWQNKKVEQGMIDRYFVNIPAGASAMKIELTSNKNTYTSSRIRLFNEEGVNIDVSPVLDSQENTDKLTRYYYELSPGVWEVDITGYFRAKDTSTYNLEIEFNGVNLLTDNVLSPEDSELRLINYYDEVRSENLSGKLLGYQKEFSVEIDGKDIYTIPFVIRKDEASKEFDITLSKEDYNKVTDFSFIILDKDGIFVEKNGLGQKEGSIKITNTSDADSTMYTLKFISGFANEPGKVKINIKEIANFKNPVSVSVKSNNKISTKFYPSVSSILNCEFSKPNAYIPKDSKPYGEIYLESTSTKDVELKLPVFFKF